MNPFSPIPQVDGVEETVEVVTYQFKSDYAEENVLYIMEEIFETISKTKLVSMVSTMRPRSAECLCTVEIRPNAGQNFSWTKMDKSNEDVFQDIRRLL